MAVLYRVGVGGVWNDINHWDLASGGAGGDGIPGVADTAIFDASSDNCTVDDVRTIGTLITATYPAAKRISIDNLMSLTVNSSGGSTIDVTFFNPGTGIGTLILAGAIICTGTGVGCGCHISITAAATVSGSIYVGTAGDPLIIAAGATVNNLDFVGDTLQNGAKIKNWSVPAAFAGTCTCTGLITRFNGGNNSTDIAVIYGADNVMTGAGNAIVGDIRIGAGNCSGLVHLSAGKVGGAGNIATVTLSDPFGGVQITNTGTIGTLNITTCSGATTFDFNSMKVSTALNITGATNLTLSGDLNYSGTIVNSVISGSTIYNSNASYGNKVYAIGANNVDGGGNINWQIGQSVASTSYSLEEFPAVNKLHSSTGSCWRYAAKTMQGQGWNKNTGSAWLWPEPLSDSLRIFNANNEVLNIVLDESTGKWYQTDVRLAPTNSTIVNSYTDKKATGGVTGTEIETEYKTAEHIGQTENQIVEHLETFVRIRPRDESLRNTTGYDSNGLRTNFAVDISGYVDGVQTAEQKTEDIPYGGDVTFAEKVEGHRVQIGVKTDTSEFRIVSHRSDYLEKDVGGNDTERTMSEMTYQQTLADSNLWLSRYLNPQLNLVTGVNFGGSYHSLVTDTNGDSYAVKFNGAGYGFTGSMADLSGDFTILAILGNATLPCTIYKKGVLDIHVVAGNILHYEDGANAKTRTLTWTGVGFCYLRISRSGATLIIGEAGVDDVAVALGGGVVNYTGTDYIGTSAVITIPDFRIYDSSISAKTYNYWYRDIYSNSGNGVLPQW